MYGSITFSDIEYIRIQTMSDLSTEEVLVILEELIRDGHVLSNENGEYRVQDDLEKEYSDYEIHMGSEEPPSYEDEYVNSEEIFRRTRSWIELHELDYSLVNRHFFLDGHFLDIFIKFIIKNAKHTIIVVNPFLDMSTPAQLLIEAKQRGKAVVFLTRPHQTERNRKIHETLVESRISLLYHRDLHAKIIVIDDLLAIITSMNFQQRATAGITWEAGLVTIDKTIVNQIKNSIVNLNPKSASV